MLKKWRSGRLFRRFRQVAQKTSYRNDSGENAAAIIDNYLQYIVIYSSADDADDGAACEGVDYFPTMTG